MFRIEVKVARGESVFLIDTLVGPKGGGTSSPNRSTGTSRNVQKGARTGGNKSVKSSTGSRSRYPFEIVHISENRIF